MRMKSWIALTGMTVLGLALAGAAIAKTYDLAEIKDGETKELGDGDHKVTATRTGDSVKVSIKGKEGEDKTFSFDVGDGASTVLAIAGDEPGCHKYTFESESGDGTKRDVKVIALASGKGRGEHCMFMGEDGVMLEGPGHHAVKIVKHIDGRMLRCPEGDATMTVEESDSGAYYCPKHNVVLEEVKGERMMKTIVVTDEETEKEAK